jgi:hypothetical protein
MVTGVTTMDDESAAGVWIYVVSVVTADKSALLLFASLPVALPENITEPVEAAEYVHVKE